MEVENEDIRARGVYFRSTPWPLTGQPGASGQHGLVSPGLKWDFKCSPFQQVTKMTFTLPVA